MYMFVMYCGMQFSLSTYLMSVNVVSANTILSLSVHLAARVNCWFIFCIVSCDCHV